MKTYGVILLMLIFMAADASEFSMEQYRWQHRPLLVFAPNEQHPDYRTMITAVDRRQRGFDERDMVLIRIFTDSGLGGNTELTATDVAGLRERYRVNPEQFRVLLVGKDGGVKQASDTAVSMEQLFTLIDGMPMRQREMRQDEIREAR